MYKQKQLDSLRIKSRELWFEYLQCHNTKKATQLLKKREKSMDKVHEVQDEIVALFLNDENNEPAKNYYVS